MGRSCGVIVASMLLVVVGFVTLLLGMFQVGEQPLQFIYVSIGACLLAGVLLIIGVARGRPKGKPISATGDQLPNATWSGARTWSRADAAHPTTESEVDTDEVPIVDSTPAPAPANSGAADDAAAFASALAGVHGVGPAKRALLQAHFGTYSQLDAASVEQIAAVSGISQALAERVHQALHG